MGRDTRLRALHTSPGAPAIAVHIDGQPVVAHLAYGQVSEYAELSPDRHHIELFPAAASQQGNELVDTELEKLRPSTDYTVVAIGEAQDLRALLVPDSAGLPGQSRAMVRCLHASPDAPALDIGITGNPALFRQVAFAQATPYQEVPAGTVDLEARRSGHALTLLAISGYTLAGGNLYTFVALGLVDGEPPFRIMPLVRAPERCPSS